MASATWNCSRLSTTFLCTPYNHAPCHFMQSHIRKVYACLAVTCHLHFWQNDWGLLRATAVTQGWNGYRNKVDPEKKIFPLLLHGSNLWPFSHESGTLTTELSPPLPVWTEQPPPPKQRSVLRSDWPVWTEHPPSPRQKNWVRPMPIFKIRLTCVDRTPLTPRQKTTGCAPCQCSAGVGIYSAMQ